jgi:DNA-binding NarL/FixJ family response regulator
MIPNHDNASGMPKKVLVIDDHILFREGLVSLFRSTPDFVIVGEAGSVQEGINSSRSLQPDIVLMDFSLPDGTGLDATQVILREIPGCKIIFLTVYEADEKLFAAIRAGAKGFLPKNVASSNLIASLRALDRDEIAISRKMTSRIVEEFSHSNHKDTLKDEIFKKISPREMDVLCELESGASNFEIAQRLFLSENTVKHHIRNILNKLEVKNRREARLIAQQAGLQSKLSAGPE